MENLLDKVLEEQGLNYEDLSLAERETYNKANFSTQKLTLSDLKEHIRYMKDSIASQLADTPETDKRTNLYLKARLKNYILLEAFIVRPEKAAESYRKALENSTKQT